MKAYLKRNSPYKLGGGRRCKLNDRTKRQIVRDILKDETLSLRNIVKRLYLNVFFKTVNRFLQTDGYKYTKYCTVSFLTEHHKQRRFEWASDILTKMSSGDIDLKQITFTDEKRFCLDGPDGARHYWQKNGELKNILGKNFSVKVSLSGVELAIMEQLLYL